MTNTETKSEWFVNRVTYQGLTFSICKMCYQVIASDRTADHLAALEQQHRCTAMTANGQEAAGSIDNHR